MVTNTRLKTKTNMNTNMTAKIIDLDISKSECIKLHKTFKNTTKLAKHYGIGRTKMYEIFDDFGIEYKKSTKPKKRVNYTD